jgi:hypothetical protein
MSGVIEEACVLETVATTAKAASPIRESTIVPRNINSINKG